MPLPVILAWIGAGPSQASQVKALAQKLEIPLPVTEKTLRAALRNPTNTPRTTTRLVDLELKIIAKVGAKLPHKLVGKGLPFLWNWEQWSGLADHVDVNFERTLFPKTRDHLRNLATQERDMVQKCLDLMPNPASAVEHLLTNPFSRLLCAKGEVPTDPLLTASKALRSGADFKHFCTSPDFRLWHAHCVVSLLMSLLSSVDLEFSAAHEKLWPKPGTMPSVVEGILPITSEGKVRLPVKRLIERWRDILGSSLRKISVPDKAWLDPEMTRRKLESWVTDEHDPSIGSIQNLLKRLVPNEWERNVAEAEFQIALLLSNAYRATENALPHTKIHERIRMFHTFHRHWRQQRSTRGKSPPP
jgi:hypothetical protein